MIAHMLHKLSDDISHKAKKSKVVNMDENMELHRLTKENENFRKIIKTQQNTLNRLIDYFILKDQNVELHK